MSDYRTGNVVGNIHPQYPIWAIGNHPAPPTFADVVACLVMSTTQSNQGPIDHVLLFSTHERAERFKEQYESDQQDEGAEHELVGFANANQFRDLLTILKDNGCHYVAFNPPDGPEPISIDNILKTI